MKILVTITGYDKPTRFYAHLVGMQFNVISHTPVRGFYTTPNGDKIKATDATPFHETVLIKGTDLTDVQKANLKFNGAKGVGAKEWISCHSFWFKGDVLSTDQDKQYPVTNSFTFLPY